MGGKHLRAAFACWKLAAYLATLVQLTDSLRFSAVHMPSLVQRNTNFWLACQFELHNQDQLYSVKWYRNNEEFYRLQFSSDQQLANGSEPSVLASIGSTSTTNSDLWQPKTAGGQQQYFAQSGLNVLMSSSNATHVRLLNASLESEGLYACEISTQNLSTIRHEKEIRVYVLPNSKLSIIGFKNRYALGDRVDLICASDFARAQAALAWFINGRRIGKASQWFTLDSQTKSKPGEPSLHRLQLGLKFKLSPQLLAAATSSQVGANSSSGSGSGSGSKVVHYANQRNQSLAKLERSRRTARLASSSSTSHQLEALQAERLELKLQCKYKLTEVSDVTFNELLLTRPDRKSSAAPLEWRRKRHQEVVRLAKTAQNQVMQSTSPASLRDLWQALGVERAACQAGTPALQPEDPLVVVPEDLAAGESQRRRRQQMDDEETNPSPEAINLNCLTISALLASESSSAAMEASDAPNEWPGEAQRAPNYCADLVMRKRTLISGRYQTNEELSVSGSASNHRKPMNRSLHQQQHHHSSGQRVPNVAYLSLSEPLTWPQQRVSSLPAESPELSSSWTSLQSSSSSSSLLAPPLLEWFINNQEAAPSSASLAKTATGGVAARRQQETLPVPPIDYADYFANFEARPLHQQLALNLSLDKKLFMTPDAQLTLRCSSTQALVLATDSISVSIIIVPESHQLGWNQRTSHRQRQASQAHQARSSASAISPGHSLQLILMPLLVAHCRWLQGCLR